ncbi:MAG: hypothetical protein B6I19_09145 [Bacteroidetes bacterium 4572_114]|nr:MAG: hypothetical protein B6I19_09145 [Bacteroidetes bacterium 4572_114]
MKLIRYGIILVFLLVVSLQGFSQVTIWLEDFSYPNGTIQGSGTPPKWTRDISACTLTPPNNDYFEVRSNRMEGRDLDGEAVWTSETIDISSYTDVSISTDVSEGGTMEPDDYIRFYYKLDGGAETLFAVNGDISNDFPPLVASQSGLNANSLVIVVRVYNNGGGERHRFDNMLVFTYVDGDNCADAIAINEVTDLSFNTTNATASGVNPGCGGTTNPVDIWYAYTATATGSGSFDLCGSAFNTRLAIYGACGGMLLACNGGNGPACTGTNASIEISVTNGVTYYVQVSGNGAATGTGDLTISVTPSTNMDDCNNAYAINEVTDFAFTTVGATAGGDNPGCGGTTNPVDIWYAYTATVTGTGFFDLCGSSYDARLAIWDACSGNVLACNDDDDYCGSGSLQSFISMQVTSSTTYYIQVGGYEDNTGAGDLTISVTPPPANDDCSNAVAINEVNDLSFSTIGASASGINPGCGGTTNPVDIWYAFTATVNGTGSFDLCGSTFNTRLAIYDACGGTVLACNDDDGPACTGTNASIEISVTSGVTYYVQVSGNEAVTGSGDLTISVNATTNMDDCGNAYAINEVTDFAFTTVGATAGGDNPGCGGGVNPIDIWYAYTATETGTGSFDLCGSSYDTRLAIWDVCSGNVLACNDDDNYCGSGSLQSFLSFAVTSGTTYYIQVGGYNARAGAGDLTISVVQSATNDDCSNAIAVTMVNDLPFTTVGATAGGDNPGCGGATDPIDIWYAFTAFISGTANFDLCGSGYDTRLAVWDACNGNVLACNDDNGPTCSGLSSSIEMTVSAGTAYYVQVGGYNALTGTGDLSIYMLSGTAGFWTGTIDSDWDTGGNWFDGNVPGASIDVQIYSSAPNYPEVDETASCNNIILGDGGSLTINSGANLTVSGDVTGDGSLIVNDGVCAISGDLNNSATALVDVNGGTLSMDGWYEAGYFSWARGVVKLSGGTINVATHVAMNNANGTSVMNGPFNLNIGGTLQMQSLSFSEITGGTITLIGSGYVLPPFGTETFAAYNLMVNATGTYVFARDALFNQDSIVNNFDILAGTVQFHSDDGTGMPVDFVVGNNLTIAAGAVLDTDVSSSMTIKGDFNNDGTATFDNNTYEVRGNVGLGSGGVLNAGTGTLTIEGNWANIGAFNHNSGTVSGLMDQQR